MSAPLSARHPIHAELELREEVYNRVTRLSAMLDAQDRSQSVADEIVSRALLIAAETDVPPVGDHEARHSRRGRDLIKAP